MGVDTGSGLSGMEQGIRIHSYFAEVEEAAVVAVEVGERG